MVKMVTKKKKKKGCKEEEAKERDFDIPSDTGTDAHIRSHEEAPTSRARGLKP